MTKITKICIALFLVFSAFSVSAQDSPKEKYPLAKVSKELYIMLDHQAPFSTTYYSDISHLGLESKEKAEAFFGWFDEKNVRFDLHFDENYVLIRLEPTEAQKDWKTEDWGMHFKMKIQEQRQEQGFVDFRER